MPQNNIVKTPVKQLGYQFIAAPYLPEGKDEYYLRNIQAGNSIQYRHLNAYEIEVLVRNRNTSDDWSKLLVSNSFNPELVKSCAFYGLVRIGKLEPVCLTFSDLKVPVGIYNSTIISCDFGDNVAVHNVNYLSHYIICNEVIIVNVNEMVTTNHAKFGNGIIKEGESEDIRIWLELCNENGKRKIMPFNGMLPGDAWLWAKFRDDEHLMQQFKTFTEKEFSAERGYYGKVGSRTVIKHCGILKDVWIGEDAYIKGANKLKNLTVNSGAPGQTQIGEGCELVNGIIDYGCRIFYGVKAVRFIMASHSQLKYGARLINSYLGNNATISCCEVLNSLIFPAHEQHHNNSFLCAALVMGQSNIPAGATLGSNHNSRSADGELQAGRGFWPALCVSVKHNSKFACFTMLSKGDYNYELNIPLPFSLISLDNAKNALVVMPSYWLMYNLYALERNAWKYADRDKRTQRVQLLETHYLAPDSINEVFTALHLLQVSTGKAWFSWQQEAKNVSPAQYKEKGIELLELNPTLVSQLEIYAEGFENSKRKTILIKVAQAYQWYKDVIIYYGALELMKVFQQLGYDSFKNNLQSLFNHIRDKWQNVGGQLMPANEVENLKQQVKEGVIQSWNDVHDYYQARSKNYEYQKSRHALASLAEIKGWKASAIQFIHIKEVLMQAIEIRKKMFNALYQSREKDYRNPYRKMMYDNEMEMSKVLGSLEDDAFIQQQQKECKVFEKTVHELIEKIS